MYGAEVEQSLLAHPAVSTAPSSASPTRVGERVVAVVQLRAGSPADLRASAPARSGSVEAPEEVLVWDDPPRSEVGTVLEPDVRARLVPARSLAWSLIGLPSNLTYVSWG